MPDKSLPNRPNLEQYKKQAKDLVQSHARAELIALDRIARYHPRLKGQPLNVIRAVPFRLTDAQLVLAREYGFESWQKLATQIITARLTYDVAAPTDPVAAFIEAACVPLDAHRSGSLEKAEMILARYPQVATANIYTAALLADASSVRGSLVGDSATASTKGGPRNWDALTYLCFSRYLRLDHARSDAFVVTARALLEFGATANTGWIEMIDHPNPRPVLEGAIYGAAGIAQHAELTRLLLEHGADPNDEETPYHVAETRGNAALTVLLKSGKLNAESLNTILLRKCDWHDYEGLRLVLEYGADPNAITRWGVSPLHQAIRRDNGLKSIDLLLDYHANPALPDVHGRSAAAMAANRGNAEALDLFERRGIAIEFEGVDALIAACAQDKKEAISSYIAGQPELRLELIERGDALLAQFSSVGNLQGVRNLLDLGVSPTALYRDGDGYFQIAKQSTALHVAAWRGWPKVVEELIARGASVNAIDGEGRTALQLAVDACVESHWTQRRSPHSVRALLEAGASTVGIDVPTGYDEIDKIFRQPVS